MTLKFGRNKKGGNVAVAIAIIVAGIIVAGAVMVTNKGAGPAKDINAQPASAEEGDLSVVTDPNADDHIKGSLDTAKVVIIEYSDTECPFCGRLHGTLDEVVKEYEGQVAWVYRHLPLTQLHSKAVIEAHATECAAELGGNDGFWKFTDRLYEVTPGNNRLDLDELPKIAEFAALPIENWRTVIDAMLAQ
jgi:protein-disulfide isomerase